MTTWVVVADSSRGKIFQQDAVRGALEEIEDLVHPTARMQGGDLVSDRPGSERGGMGQGAHVYDTRTDVRKHEAETFAREIAERLEEARTGGALDKLVLMAPPEFLGQLRERLGGEVRKLVVGEIPKDMVKHSNDEVREKVRELL